MELMALDQAAGERRNEQHAWNSAKRSGINFARLLMSFGPLHLPGRADGRSSP